MKVWAFLNMGKITKKFHDVNFGFWASANFFMFLIFFPHSNCYNFFHKGSNDLKSSQNCSFGISTNLQTLVWIYLRPFGKVSRPCTWSTLDFFTFLTISWVRSHIFVIRKEFLNVLFKARQLLPRPKLSQKTPSCPKSTFFDFLPKFSHSDK